jgi:hypothetical protein
MKLIYTFTRKLNHTSLERTVEIYKKSYEKNSKFHQIVLYTDEKSKNLLDDTFDNIKIIETSDVLFFDDLKFKVLYHLNEDEMLCDGDLFLNKKLQISGDYDLMFDCLFDIENSVNYEFYEYYRNVSKILVDHKITDTIPFYKNNLEKVINIGLLWFKDEKIKNKFLDFYFLQKNWIIKNELEKQYNFTKDFKNSVTFSQYFLTLFVNEYKLKSQGFRDYSDYIHYSGSVKYSPNFMKRFEKKII